MQRYIIPKRQALVVFTILFMYQLKSIKLTILKNLTDVKCEELNHSSAAI